MNNPSKTPAFRLYSDGLSTFLAIAADTLESKAANQELTAADIHVLREQRALVSDVFSEAMETLAYACLDNSSQDSNTAPAALAMAAGFIREMGNIAKSLNMADTVIKADKKPSGESWPDC